MEVKTTPPRKRERPRRIEDASTGQNCRRSLGTVWRTKTPPQATDPAGLIDSIDADYAAH